MPDRVSDISDPLNRLTESQRRAVTILGQSVLVSAAAGAGKTTVLAERCADLVCRQRCRVDELLVVTFTDAAAGEMRMRIEAVIRRELEKNPADGFLNEQLHLLDAANISTIHAFCKSLIQRWFPQAGVDPQAAVLSGEEAELLRREVLDGFFVELYEGQDELAEAFRRWVDDYGGGNDYKMIGLVLDLHGYLGSLADPEQWLAMSRRQLDPTDGDGLAGRLHSLQRDRIMHALQGLGTYAGQQAALIRRCWPIAADRADNLDEFIDDLGGWWKTLHDGPAETWETVAEAIRQYGWTKANGRPRKISAEEKAAFDAALDVRNKVKELFEKKVAKQICAFSAAEYAEGLERIRPYVDTLIRLVTEFEERYQAAKAARAAVDFNDLQRFACRLLCVDGDPNRPSEVARQMQRQFRYVLVDEFQDIDPLQEAILRLVSRESADPPEGNLFAVGDIKQSIYRFRLAEPDLFANRAERFANDAAAGALIFLRENFRSRPELIEAVNFIFQGLMSRAFGGSDYDERARLVAGKTFPPAVGAPVFDRPAVELHLLEPVTARNRPTRDDDDNLEQDESPADEMELEALEREAYLIGRRIQYWMGDNPGKQRYHLADKPADAGGPPDLRPLEYKDIVILLRSMPHKADPIADVLRRMGIPVHVERGDDNLDSTEFNDCVSLLRVLDNQQQDIPLAAAMRGPLLGGRFSESDLLEIRLADRTLPFHEAVRKYAVAGPDRNLRERLEVFLARLDRYRRRIQRAPVAEALWEIIEASDYPAYVAGLPDGMRRREHLVRLHELARQFGHFSRQGLRRFLRFLDDLVASDQSWKQPSGGSAEDNLVRIMTIHTSKGLEFPVVILADLSKRFNLTDTRQSVLVDRKFGLAMQAADPEKRIYYPTLIHQLAAEHVHRESLAEELRVLYVALTRAREHLMLVGRYDPGKAATLRGGQVEGDGPHVLSTLELETATNPLDWLIPVIASGPGRLVAWPGENRPSPEVLFEVHTHDRAATDEWRIPPAEETGRYEQLVRLADLRPLPDDEPRAPDGAADELIDFISGRYPALELTALPARVAVSELKRRWEALHDPDEQRRPSPRPATPARPLFVSEKPSDDPAARGTATHRFLQLVDLARPCDLDDLREQCRRMNADGRLGRHETSMVMLEAAAWFFETELGRRVREAAARVRREIAFISRILPQDYDRDARGRDNADVILIRGMIDLLLEGDKHLEIVDFKTDRIETDACPARARDYQTQIRTYAKALANIYRRDVTSCFLVFLHARRIIEMERE
ncbi:MAG: helicase-exonuclease AddAB subunit AddA [Phycisphaerales bacterium]|nr:helicase-exonuclease AddAB subunit AddA [Phycisphaerales bacterium]